MDEIKDIKTLTTKCSEYQERLIELSRLVSKLNDFLKFIDMCIDFAYDNFPKANVTQWANTSGSLIEVEKRSHDLFTQPIDGAYGLINSVVNTAGTASIDSYSYIVNNYAYIESNEERTKFLALTETYKGLITNDAAKGAVVSYLHNVNQTAEKKFVDGSNQLLSLSEKEDPEGPLLELRSALEITIRELVDRASVENGKKLVLKQTEVLPFIANFLAKDELAKIDLILINPTYTDLWQKLSKLKNVTVPRDIAVGLAIEVTSLLGLIARTVK